MRRLKAGTAESGPTYMSRGGGRRGARHAWAAPPVRATRAVCGACLRRGWRMKGGGKRETVRGGAGGPAGWVVGSRGYGPKGMGGVGQFEGGGRGCAWRGRGSSRREDAGAAAAPRARAAAEGHLSRRARAQPPRRASVVAGVGGDLLHRRAPTRLPRVHLSRCARRLAHGAQSPRGSAAISSTAARPRGAADRAPQPPRARAAAEARLSRRAGRRRSPPPPRARSPCRPPRSTSA